MGLFQKLTPPISSEKRALRKEKGYRAVVSHFDIFIFTGQVMQSNTTGPVLEGEKDLNFVAVSFNFPL